MKALASDFDGTLYFENGVKEDDRKAILLKTVFNQISILSVVGLVF